jgi:hypothetical protein
MIPWASPQPAPRWCILRTSGGQTLPLAAWLRGAGFNVWTPARTIRKLVRRGTRTEQRLEVDIPILPTFVFARERDLPALADVIDDQDVLRPAFSIFRYNGRIPLVGDREVVGLREEEEREAATMQAIRDAETHEEAERIRIAAIKLQSARRRAMKQIERDRLADRRAQRRAFEPGTEVEVADMPALAGVAGVVEASDGVHAHVRFGTQSWKIEGWRLSPRSSEYESA